MNPRDLPPLEQRGGRLLRVFARWPWHVAAVALLLVITIVPRFTRRIPEPPPVLFPVPEFELQDQDGQPFSLASMRGKVWVAGFFFTSCPSTCPKISRAMLDLQRRFARNGVDAHLVSFSVDPETDTPAVLARYAEHLGADPGTWRFVTGERAAVEALVVGGFKTAMDRRPAPGDVPSMYDIAHSEKLALIDGDGHVRGYFAVRRPTGAPPGPLPMGVTSTPEAEALGLDAVSLDELYHRTTHVLREARQREGGCNR
jgi:protein SCO1/2